MKLSDLKTPAFGSGSPCYYKCEVEELVAQLEAENKRYLETLRSIAGTNTKPSHLKKNWKEMMLAAKQRAKEALGGE